MVDKARQHIVSAISHLAHQTVNSLAVDLPPPNSAHARSAVVFLLLLMPYEAYSSALSSPQNHLSFLQSRMLAYRMNRYKKLSYCRSQTDPRDAVRQLNRINCFITLRQLT